MSQAQSLYEIATEEMEACILRYLQLIKRSNGLATLTLSDFTHPIDRIILLAGKGASTDLTAAEAEQEWLRRAAVPFDVESGVSFGVYVAARVRGDALFDEAEKLSAGFTNYPAEQIAAAPNLLPIWQHVGGIFSKAALKKHVGSVSDKSISKPAAGRLAALLTARVKPEALNKADILQRLESTLEGIVRDLVGRLLLESIVDAALRARGVTFQRENEYKSLAGVIYDFRADFVAPTASAPKAFIEVRKSSSRHASLYAKDKMFSAINWKGKTPDLMGIIVVDGDWTGETLRAMANIFDYVVPLNKVEELADTLFCYLAGDKTKLKWLVTFKIEPA